MPPKYLFQTLENRPATSVGRQIAARLSANDEDPCWTLDELVELYADEFPGVDDLPDLLTVDDLSELTETFNERGCVIFLEGVPAMRREESFRAQLEALLVGETLQIEPQLQLRRTE